MENFYSAVIPAKAGIQWLQELGDPRFRGDDGKGAGKWPRATLSST
jgi:hypothetical protein